MVRTIVQTRHLAVYRVPHRISLGAHCHECWRGCRAYNGSCVALEKKFVARIFFLFGAIVYGASFFQIWQLRIPHGMRSILFDPRPIISCLFSRRFRTRIVFFLFFFNLVNPNIRKHVTRRSKSRPSRQVLGSKGFLQESWDSRTLPHTLSCRAGNNFK